MAFEPFFHFMRGIQGKLNNGGLGNANGGQNAQQIAFIRNLQKEKKQERCFICPFTPVECRRF